MDQLKDVELTSIAREVRMELIKYTTRTGAGHLASSLSMIEILVSLYFDENLSFNHIRDKLFFGKAHGGPAVYPILAKLGYFDKSEMDRYCMADGILRMHPDQSIPGCTYVGGSLGNALGFSAGLAQADKTKRAVTILGDAELYEGSVWEAFFYISHHNLNNLLTVVDRNGLGILGPTEELLRLEPLSEKLEAFGFNVVEINGHSFEELRKSFNQSTNIPTVVIAHTVKAKGVDFMENKPEYHTIIPRDHETITQMLEGLK